MLNRDGLQASRRSRPGRGRPGSSATCYSHFLQHSRPSRVRLGRNADFLHCFFFLRCDRREGIIKAAIARSRLSVITNCCRVHLECASTVASTLTLFRCLSSSSPSPPLLLPLPPRPGGGIIQSPFQGEGRREPTDGRERDPRCGGRKGARTRIRGRATGGRGKTTSERCGGRARACCQRGQCSTAWRDRVCASPSTPSSYSQREHVRFAPLFPCLLLISVSCGPAYANPSPIFPRP